jgi:hypothetical protein
MNGKLQLLESKIVKLGKIIELASVEYAEIRALFIELKNMKVPKKEIPLKNIAES